MLELTNDVNKGNERKSNILELMIIRINGNVFLLFKIAFYIVK